MTPQKFIKIMKQIIPNKIRRIVRYHLDGAALYKQFYKDTSRYTVPLSDIKSLKIVISYKCNHRCKMCYQDNYSSDLDRVIYEEKLRPIYPYLEEICLQGGEATLMPQAREFVELVNKINPRVKFSMLTNGELFDNYWIEKFVNYGAWVNFSLNAASKKTYQTIHKNGDWDKVIANIKALDRSRRNNKSAVEIWTSIVIVEDNIQELSEFVEFSKYLNANRIKFFYDPNQLPKDINIISRELNKVQQLKSELKEINFDGLDVFESWIFDKRGPITECPWTTPKLFIDAEGNVFSCCGCRIRLGNLNKHSIEKLWNNRLARLTRMLISTREFRFRYCYHYCRDRSTV